MGAEHSPKKWRTFSMLALALWLVAIVVFFFAVGIRGLRSSQRSSNERNASRCLRALVDAEAEFRSRDRDSNGVQDYWTGDVAGLRLLTVGGREIALIEADLARADARPLQAVPAPPVPYHGYLFVAMERDDPGPGESHDYRADTDASGRKVHHRTHFAFCAYPASPDAGDYAFVANEGGTVFRLKAEGKPILVWPTGLHADFGGPLR
jgi:hypothetical protein